MSVYFVTCREAGAVKIGSSLHPHLRLREIQWGCPMPVALEAMVSGGQEEERVFHGRFADDRLRGEWFSITPMIEAIIAANPAPPPEERTGSSRYRPPISNRTLPARVRAQLRIPMTELARMLNVETKTLRSMERGFGKWKNPPEEIQAKLRALETANG